MLTTSDTCAAVVAHLEAAGHDEASLRTMRVLRPEVLDDLYAGRRVPCVAQRRRLALLAGTTPWGLLEHPEAEAC